MAVRDGEMELEREDGQNPMPSWTLVTSHGLVLLYLAAYSDSTMRAVSEALGLTERRVVDIIKDLEKADLLKVTHQSRGNHYSLNPDARFRHPVISRMPFADFLQLWRISVDGEEAPASTDA